MNILLSPLLAVLIIPALAAAPKESPVNKPPLEFAGVARFPPLEGWTVRRTEGTDPSLILSRDQDIIKARLFGGKGSRYLRLPDYLKGFEATTMGNPPEKVREATVSGLRIWFYRHGYPLMQGDPSVMDPRPPMLASEEFCILPVGGRFLVLSWAVESPAPDPDAPGEAVWQSFLDSFSLIKKK
jgi:hypothetical protein